MARIRGEVLLSAEQRAQEAEERWRGRLAQAARVYANLPPVARAAVFQALCPLDGRDRPGWKEARRVLAVAMEDM